MMHHSGVHYSHMTEKLHSKKTETLTNEKTAGKVVRKNLHNFDWIENSWGIAQSPPSITGLLIG